MATKPHWRPKNRPTDASSIREEIHVNHLPFCLFASVSSSAEERYICKQLDHYLRIVATKSRQDIRIITYFLLRKEKIYKQLETTLPFEFHPGLAAICRSRVARKGSGEQKRGRR